MSSSLSAAPKNSGNSAILLFAHGSALAAANEVVERVAGQLASRAGCPAIAAFLEKAQPDFAEAIARLVGAGMKRVIIVPYFLTMGTHISRDLPELALLQQSRFPGLRIQIAAPMEGHPLLVDVLLDRMRAMTESREVGNS
jgi:sirohydrochlorin ferrochelatase